MASTALRGARMTTEEYLALIDAMGIKAAEAGRIFGWQRRQGQRYANGQPVPAPARKLLRLARLRGIGLWEIAKL